jgi:sugar lactone lactonase YvrE
MLNKILNKVTLLLILSLAFVSLAHVHLTAVEVKKKEIVRFDDFQQGEFKGTSLDSKGRLFIGPRIKEFEPVGREYYLALDTAANGDIYIGTGHNGSLFRIPAASNAPPPAGAKQKPPPARAKEIFSSEELDIYGVVVKKNGDVFAATSPDGKIYKISTTDKTKKGSVFFNPGEKFIWDLKEDLAGNLVAAVGNGGGVYRIDKKGAGAKIFTPEDNHIISLYITRGNAILAGSGDRGILYRIDDRKARVLFDSPFEEVRGICEDKDGNIYFSATKGIYTRRVSRPAGTSKVVKKKKEDEPPRILEKSILYRYNTNGIVERVWSSRTEYIYTLAYDKKNDSVLIGTGNAGRVYRVHKDRSFAIVYESDSAQIFKLTGKPGGFTLITNNTASIVKIEDGLNSRGSYFSDIFDLQIQSKLGRLYWEAGAPGRTSVQVAVRTGKSNVPDSTWTQWSPPFSDNGSANIGISNCRYFQLKVILNSLNSADSPYLESLKVYYIQSNLAPRMKRVSVKKPNPRLVKSKTGVKKIKKKNLLSASWNADDPNKDKLKYNVYIKKTSDKNWILIKEDTTVSRFELDTRLYDDGKYLMRVVADDALANPPASARRHALESPPFLIDSTAPAVANFAVTGRRLTFSVTDSTSIISDVLYSHDGKLWFPVFPKDMLNDSGSEAFDFTLPARVNKKLIFLKVVDEFDNSKVFQKEF